MDDLVQSLTLDPQWREAILTKISNLSEQERVSKERVHAQERLRRLGRAFIDGLVEEYLLDLQSRPRRFF